MKITLLGHASLLVEAQGPTRVLVDPVFFDPFEGDAVSCPKREVHVDKLPPVDAVILSHAHRDHFDPPSLRRLSRQTRMFCPPDEELVYALRREGFSKVQVFEPWIPRSVGSLELTGTPSRDPLEQGILLREGSVSFWNQVDTVVTQETCVGVLERCGGTLDAAICTYQPLIEYGLTWTSEAQFPVERYERLLEMALCCRAKVLLPGSAGLRMGEGRSWCNGRMFPATRERFLRDVQSLEPAQAVEILNPGDSLSLSANTSYERGTSDNATTLEHDTAKVTFEPDATSPAMADPNPWNYNPEDIARTASAVVEEHLQDYIRGAQSYRLRGPLRTLWDRRAVVGIEVCTPSGMSAWHISEWEPKVRISRGPHPDPDYVFSYVGSEVLALMRDENIPQPTLRIRRRRGDAPPGRLHTLNPARLHDVDLYFTVDEEYLWNPLGDLLQGGD